ncbi:MAG: NAD(P)-dependent oxidoreductase [Stellaceae bacterium]
MRVLLHYDAGPALCRRLAESMWEGLHIDVCGEADQSRFEALIAQCDVLWHVLKPIDAADIARAPRLALIQKIGVGVNTIDCEAARRRGIAVCNMPGTNSQAVAEMTLALMLSVLRRLPAYDAASRGGQGWRVAPDAQDKLGEIGGKTVGLIGAGMVPRLLAPVLAALGATVIYTSRRPKADFPGLWRELPSLLAESDIISLHVPLTNETMRMIDREAIARVKPGAMLINTARGGLVDQAALIDALKEGRLRGAGLDVFAEEPIPAGDPVLTLDKVVVTPHVAWLTAETWERSLVVALENCRRLARGAVLLNRVA